METTVTPRQRFRWVADPDPRWDDDRARVFATVPAGVLPDGERRPGERLPGDWWRVEAAGGDGGEAGGGDGGGGGGGARVVGYGWLDDVWGDAEILLAVEAPERGTGAGSFALAGLEREAAARGLNYVVNQVRPGHPERERVTAWFLAHGFHADDDGRLRKRVAAGADPGQAQAGRPGARPAPAPDDARRARYEAERDRAAARTRDTAAGGAGDAGDAAGAGGAPMGPGHEESGGYVDPEQHRY